MAGPRSYNEGTRQGLFTLANGTCYFPGCEIPTIVFVEGVPSINVHVAHIRGAHKGSQRYDPAMSDAERAAFENLILLCKPHHDLVDRIRPSDYPVEVLQSWKVAKEAGGLEALHGLGRLTETRLAELLEDAIRAAGSRRLVTVGLTGGWLVDGTALASGPIDGWVQLLELNPDVKGDLVLATKARNQGALGASAESFSIYLCLEGDAEMTLAGRNDFPVLNPRLPIRLESGDAATWLTRLSSLRMMLAAAKTSKVGVDGFRASVQLGSGETISSEVHSVEHLPA
jgi:hypothetical protein